MYTRVHYQTFDRQAAGNEDNAGQLADKDNRILSGIACQTFL
jgi:hypothetical protein